jgi:hypothetical protein
MTLLMETKKFRFYMTERKLRSKLTFNNYYTFIITRVSSDNKRYDVCHTKSFNKVTYPNSKELAYEYFEKMKHAYA